MVRSRIITAVLVFVFVGGLASGCRKQAAPTRPAPATKQAPPGPPGGGLILSSPDPAKPPKTGESANQSTDGTGQ